MRITPANMAIEAREVIGDILRERKKNRERWGVQDYPDGTREQYEYLAIEAREDCQEATEHGHVTWSDVLREEVFEAFAETDSIKLRAELVQVAAVCVAWIEAIDRRGKS